MTSDDLSHTISIDGPFPPERNRYILYVALPCPFAARCLYVRTLKGLEEIIDVAITDYELSPTDSWTFDRRNKEATGDPVYGKRNMIEIYRTSDPGYDQRVSVPVLFDKKQGKIVSKESAEIMRIFNTAFDELVNQRSSHRGLTFYPTEYAAQIDELNEWIMDRLSTGVYKAGFAQDQSTYDSAVIRVFEGMDRLEALLSDGREHLIPQAGLTEADLRLMPTLLRFDVAYFLLFKCNIRTIRDGYPNIHRYMRSLYWKTPAIKDWTNFDHIKKGYGTLYKIHSNNIVPAGPIPSILPL